MKMETAKDEEAGHRPALSRTDTPMKGVHLSCYKIESDGRLSVATVEDALARQKIASESNTNEVEQSHHEQEPSFWIDADCLDDSEDRKELDHIIRQIHLNPFLRKHLGHREQLKTTQVFTLNESAFLAMRVLPPPQAVDARDVRYVAALCVHGLLLTVTTSPKGSDASTRAGRRWNQSIRTSIEEREMPEASASGALVMWLLVHVQRLAAEAQKLRLESYDLDEKLDSNANAVGIEELVAHKHEVNKVVAIAEEQMESLQALKEGDELSSGLDFTHMNGAMGIVLSHASSNVRAAVRLEKRVADLKSTYDSLQQDRINQRLEVLTILSAVFLPLTLMAGLWGMNFVNMPELRDENGYFYALAGMGAVAILCLALFWRFGWFR